MAALAETLEKDGIIVADTTDINADPYAFIAYSAGYGVHGKCHNNSECCFETNISDLVECLSYKSHFAFSAKELKVLERNGIERVKEGRKFVFKQFLENKGLENEIFLTETRFEGRTQRIETIKKGDAVKLVHDSSDMSYINKVDVLSENGSLGLLDARSADIMAPLIDSGEKEFTAVVQSVTPLSARSSGCRTAIVSIHIQFKVAPLEDDEDEMPKSSNTSTKTVGGADDVAFSYGQIDEIGTGFYDGIWNGKEFVIPKDATIAVSTGGKTVKVKNKTSAIVKGIAQTFNELLSGKETDTPFYNPISAVNGNLVAQVVDEPWQDPYEVSDNAERLNAAQIVHRIKLFVKTVSLMNDESALTKVVEAAPKKWMEHCMPSALRR